jgi:hypothetical protein
LDLSGFQLLHGLHSLDWGYDTTICVFWGDWALTFDWCFEAVFLATLDAAAAGALLQSVQQAAQAAAQAAQALKGSKE